MGFWLTFFLWVGSFLLTDYFRAKLPNQEPSGEGDFQSPTSTEGRKVPQVVGGTVKVKGPNTLWRGEWEAIPVQVETGVVFKRDETVGYQYNIALALGQFIGRAAGMTAIYVGDDKVWDYVTDNSGNPAMVADVDLPDLWGGETKGGGFVGRFRAFNGQSNTVSTFLSSRVTNQSAWPGMVYVVLTNLTETAGANIGEANQLRDIRIEWQCHDTIANGGLGNELSLTGDKHIIGRDANPISCAYRILTDADWSVSLGDIDFSNFQAAADTCYNEGIGYSQLVDSETETFEILAEIEKHIDGYIGPNPQTGLMEVTLARSDYVAASEFQATEDNIIAINDFAKPEWPQTKNEVKVRFVNRDKDYADDHAVAQDMAGRLIAGRPQSITIRYPGLRDATAANKIVARTARTYFWPLAKFQLEIDRTGWELRPGSVVVVTHPDIGATDLATRVTKISVGDPVKQTIIVDVVEDVFADEVGIQSAPQPSGDVPPPTDPTAVVNFDTTLAPRWFLNKEGQAMAPRLIYLVARDAPNTGYYISYRYRLTYTSGNFTGEIADQAVPVFSQYGTLRNAVGLLKHTSNNGTATVANGGGFEVDGNLASVIGTYSRPDQEGIAIINPRQANEEVVQIGTITANGAGVECANVVRGVGDTAILAHEAGEPVWFLSTGAYLQKWVAESDGDTDFGFQYKIGPVAQGVQGTLSAFQGEQRVDDDRYTRPLPPNLIAWNQLGTTNFFADGDVNAGYPDNIYFPPASGLNLTVYNRRFDQDNAVFGANSLDDVGGIYPTNAFSDVNPTFKWYVYDLDVTPTPVRGDEVMSGTSTAEDDRANGINIPESDFQDTGLSSPINARWEFVWENTVDLEEVLLGVESKGVFQDKSVAFNPAPDSRDTIPDLQLLLHMEGNPRTTQFIDYSTHDHTVVVAGDAIVDEETGDTGTDYPVAGVLKLDNDGDYLEVVDVAALDHDLPNKGLTVSCRVKFSVAPSGLQPLVTKWRTSDNQREFFCGLNGTTMRAEWSTDGTAVTTRSTGGLSWTTGVWYELTWVFWQAPADTLVYFYRDGAYISRSQQNGLVDFFKGTAPLRVGADGDGNTVTQTMHMDEVRVLNGIVSRTGGTWPQLERWYPGRNETKVLHCNWENAADQAKAYTCDDLNRLPVLIPATAATKIDTAQSKFGTQSLRCSGVNGHQSTFDLTDGVAIDDTEALGLSNHLYEFGTGDFTMEGFVRFTVAAGSFPHSQMLISKFSRGAFPFLNWQLYVNSSGQLVYNFRPSDNSGDKSITGSAQTVNADTWYHFAIVRKNGVMSLFWEGNRVAQELTTFLNLDINNWGDGEVCLGRYRRNSSNQNYPLNGWLDEIRIQRDVAEYDGATYTVPTAAFPVDPILPESPPLPTPSNFTPSGL